MYISDISIEGYKNCNNKYSYVFTRNVKAKKSYNEIEFSSIRGGKLAGEHTVIFLGNNESIELTHTAYSRSIYIEGALRAAEFIINKKNGLYSMDDI